MGRHTGRILPLSKIPYIGRTPYVFIFFVLFCFDFFFLFCFFFCFLFFLFLFFLFFLSFEQFYFCLDNLLDFVLIFYI